MSGTDYTQTTNYGLYKPLPNADINQWGAHLNLNADTLDGVMHGFLPLSGGTATGPLIYTATGGTTPRAAQDRAADVANVLDFGADPTGVADSAPAINAAAARGRAVYLPMGTYRLLSSITVGASQMLYGEGVGTVLNIDSDFSPSASGVIVITPGPDPISQANIHSTLRAFQINFTVPAETITTATAAATAGATTIQVASAANIRIGFYAANATTPASVQRTVDHQTGTKVTAIAGNVITLDTAVLAPGIANGDTIQFAPSRAQYAALGSASNLPGGTGTQYPWAVYNNGANNLTIDGLFVRGSWNGIYQRGDAFDLRNIAMCAINVGLDIDTCFNFPVLANYRFFNWGFEHHSAGIGPYYDGATVAASIGQCDGVSILGFQTWIGQLNIKSNFSWGHIVNLMLDGDKSNLNILGASGFLMITNAYSTKGASSIGVPITINAGTGTVRFTNLHTTNTGAVNTLLLQSGYCFINSGNHFNGIIAANVPSFNVTGGRLYVGGGMRLATQFTAPSTICFANSGSGVLQIEDVTFDTPAAGGIGFQITDNVANFVRNIVWNGWAVTGVVNPPLGYYDIPGRSYFPAVTATSGSLAVGNATLATSPALVMNSASGVTRQFQSLTASSVRWSWGSNSTAENTGNVGCDFFINAWDNAGSLLWSPITITRSTGLVTMARGTAITGGTIDAATIGGTTPGAVVGTSIRTNSPTGPTFTGGAGAPASTQPVGSIYSNVTGTTGTRLYVSAGAGTWNPVAGV